MNNHTIDLLKECDSGTKTAVNSIKEVMDNINSQSLRELLTDSLDTHEKLGNEIHSALSELGEKGKEPNPMAKGMSWLKTSMKMTMDSSDETVADLMVDGCNMGTKSLHKYLNQYSHATDKAKKLVEDVLKEEEGLAEKLREYL